MLPAVVFAVKRHQHGSQIHLVYNNQTNNFTGGKQTFPASATGYASLNVPNTGTAPSSPQAGDLWLLGSDIHLQFQDKNSATQSLAFLTDLQTADSTTLASAKSYTDTSLATEAAARIAADATTLSSAKSYTDTAAATTLSSAKSYTDSSAATTWVPARAIRIPQWRRRRRRGQKPIRR